ncbi:hypothetical protein K2173_005432 [Erythroxylum novogranatense]|uniref:Uncharacterized protein n=1 Tax=Erythroxylum novogranatense TaxID=1862640 RepID=A0AAV8T512_9ROSI|nr:hypothetical protein K2173_005432 [Erythroxylum novogranatense]
MDASELVDSLDSLWSITNVLSSRTHKVTGNGRNVHDQEEDKRPAKPINPNDQNQPNEPTEAKLVTPRCSVCGEPVHPRSFHQELGVPKPKRRRSGKARSKRKVAHEEHKLAFDGNIWFLMSRVYPVKMPPLDDGLAMKQHLKSWAYAVACSVR